MPRSGQQLLDIAVGQAEAQIPADRQHDHIGWEAEAAKADRGIEAGRGRQGLMPTVSRLEGGHRERNRAIGTKVTPVEVTTDQAPVYPAVLEELLPAAWHRTERYANNRVECDHGRLKARLQPMRRVNQDRSARVITAGHALVQNVRRVPLRAGG